MLSEKEKSMYSKCQSMGSFLLDSQTLAVKSEVNSGQCQERNYASSDVKTSMFCQKVIVLIDITGTNTLCASFHLQIKLNKEQENIILTSCD